MKKKMQTKHTMGEIQFFKKKTQLTSHVKTKELRFRKG